MNTKKIEQLENQVATMLSNVDLIRKYIEGHEFDLARARILELHGRCIIANNLANRLADEENY